MKIFRLILIGIPILAVVFLGTWMAVNLWPRSMESPLWTEADLPLPPEGPENGYRDLVALKADRAFRDLEVEIEAYIDSEPLYDLMIFPFIEEREKLALFWATVTTAGPTLEELSAKHNSVIPVYRRLAGRPFVDRDSFHLNGGEKAPWLLLNDIKKIASLDLLRKALKGEGEVVYDLWLETFRMDRDWLSSARSPISHAAALGAVKRDLSLLSLLRAFPIQSKREEILKAVSELDMDRIHYKRALIFEYLFALDAESIVVPEMLHEKSLWLRLVYNRSLFRKDLNRRFRDSLEEGEEGVGNYRDNPFWWFFNPAGKSLGELLFIDLSDSRRNFEAEKEEIRSMRAKILAPGFFAMEPLKVSLHLP